MWLPTDERRLLKGYHRLIGEVGDSKAYRVSNLRPLLMCCNFRVNVPEYGAPEQASDNVKPTGRGVKKYVNETNRIERANKHLYERGLIELEPQ